MNWELIVGITLGVLCILIFIGRPLLERHEERRKQWLMENGIDVDAVVTEVKAYFPSRYESGHLSFKAHGKDKTGKIYNFTYSTGDQLIGIRQGVHLHFKVNPTKSSEYVWVRH